MTGYEQTNGQTNGTREGGKWGRFAYAYKICRGGAISRPIAWKTHAKISILARNQIKQDQRLDLTIGITGQRSSLEREHLRAYMCASAHTYATPRTLRNVVCMRTGCFMHAVIEEPP